MAPLISVITPSFNQGRFIERTIQSVLEQGIAELEYFVVDGGSQDETVEILKKYEPRIRWVSEKDNGQSDAVNKGLRATTGEIIGWLNSDDIYYSGALLEVVNFFKTNPEVDVIYGNANHIDKDDRVIEPYYTEDWDYERLKDICFICQPSVFFRRRIIEKAGLLDDSLNYCMDYEYWLRLGKSADFKRINSTLAGSRMYESNKTLSARIAVHQEINDMLKDKFGCVPNKWIFAFAHVAVEQKGYGRTAPKENVKFVLWLTVKSLSSFLRWRKWPSVSAISMAAGWLVGAARVYYEKRN